MDLGLKDKVALVTGASRGIGKRIALALAEEGAKLCICARTEEVLKEAACEIEAQGVEVATAVQDVMTPEGAEEAVATAKEHFGGLDILINNVGGSKWTPFVEISNEEWDEILNLSFLSAVRVSRAAIPSMEERGGGSIINISSIFGRESGGPISYNAAKSAMISMGANLAIETAARNIRVNTVAPGSIIFPGGSWERRMKEDPEKIQAFIDGSTQTVDGYTGATALGMAAESVKQIPYSQMDMFWGLVPGSIGETSFLMCMIGAAVLILTGVGSWRTMAGVFIGGIVTAFAFHASAGSNTPSTFDLTMMQHLLLGGFAFGAIFMATDPVTSPFHNNSKWIYGFLIGVLAVLIRNINPAYPEGMMLAILFMNIFSPLIDHYVVGAALKRRAAHAG